MLGPLHEGYYRGHCLSGDDIHEAVMTVPQALAWAAAQPQCMGFTFKHEAASPPEAVRVWFKSKLKVLCNDDWWSYSLGRGMD